LLLTDRAVEQYYVTEATAESYAKVALKPFLSDFAKWKYRLRKDHSGPQFRRM